MKLNIQQIFLFCCMLTLLACSQPVVEPGLETIPTVEEPVEEVSPTETPSPTNTAEPTATAVPTEAPTEEPTMIPTEEAEVEIEVVDEPAEDALADVSEELADLFGIEIINEGTLSMEALGVSFEIPEGWSGLQMMGLMAMATSTSLDLEMGVESLETEDGVIVMFLPTGITPFEDLSNYSTDELMDEMANGGNDMDLQDVEVLNDRVPVTVNGYEGFQTSLQGTDEGELMFMEITILEHEGIGYMMMYVGPPAVAESERENFEALKNTLVLTVPDEEALVEAGEEALEDLTGLFGGDMVTEGRLDIPAIGVSFEVPAGWTAMSMMGFLAMATNSSMDVAMGDNQMAEGVLVMFTPADGATIEEAWGETSEEMMSSIMGPGGEFNEEDVEILKERVPVTLNGYAGERTSMRVIVDGEAGFIEMTILEHEGATYTMMYAGSEAEYETERANFDFLVSTLILTTPDPSAVDFGDFGDFEEEAEDGSFDDYSLDIDEPSVTELLPMNSTVMFDGGTEIGYQTEVEVGATYLIYLHSEADTTLHVFPADSEPIGYLDERSDNYELLLWTADVPLVTMTGRFFFEDDGEPIKLSIFQVADLEANSQTISVAEGETYFVVGSDAGYDTKLTVMSDSDSEATYVDYGYGNGSAEFVLLNEPGEYEITLSDWGDDEPVGSLFIVQLENDECCTLP